MTASNDAPDLISDSIGKGYYQMDDGEMDPFDELLDSYQSFVRMGKGELATAVMEIIHEVELIMLAEGSPKGMMKGSGGEYSNPVACLSQAYLGLILSPSTRPIASKVLALLDRATTELYDSNDMMTPEGGDDQEIDQETDQGMPPVDSGMYRSDSVRREIRQENAQYCVYSQTGRAFGCYSDRNQALERLAQIEQFAQKTLAPATKQSLVEWHNAAHTVTKVTSNIKDIHDLISDQLEVIHGLSSPYAFDLEEKIEIIERSNSGMISKAAEYRYTLGPAYVPDREDAHGEFTDATTLQLAMWDWVRKGDRNIYLQHSDRVAGEMVELLTLPFPLEADMSVPNQGVAKYQFPANTPFLGVIWEPWSWELVKSGQLRGYSIGGKARRVEADLPTEGLI